MKSCVVCGAVASLEPEYEGWCPDCVLLTWNVAAQLYPETDIIGDWEKKCFPETQETLEDQRDRVLKKLISGLPELMVKLETVPGCEVKLSWVNPPKLKPKPL